MKLQVRHANKADMIQLQQLPPYSNISFPYQEEILLASMRENTIMGAISIGQKDINCVPGEWKDVEDASLKNAISPVSGFWISKLYVVPKYRAQKLGVTLVKEALNIIRSKGSDEVYVGIHVGNEHRHISRHIFEKHGFKAIGSCICFLAEGHCRGWLFRLQME